MIRKFARVPACGAGRIAVLLAILLAGAAIVSAQQDPAPTEPPQTPQTQPQQTQTQPPQDQSGSQEATPEETASQRRIKPKGYTNWSFNVGGGTSLTNGTTTKFARGGGPIGDAGVARNSSKYLGLRLDFQWDDLPLRNTALQSAEASGATSHVYTLMLDPIINVPVTNEWAGYIVFGPSYLHRSGKLDSSGAVPGSLCNPFWVWWGRCYAGSLPVNGNFLTESQNQFGYNFGGGIARKIRPNIEIYGEFRFIHGTHNGITTDFRPVTIGLRWGK